MNREIIYKAMKFAIHKHIDQKRDDGRPYIVHPEQTAWILERVVPNDPEMIAAAWLHDTLEDTDTTYSELREGFGERVAGLVQEVTQEKSKFGEQYFPRLQTREGIMIKLADRLSNLSDMKGWDDEKKQRYMDKTKFWKSEPSS